MLFAWDAGAIVTDGPGLIEEKQQSELNPLTCAMLKPAHIIGAILIGAGLIGVWLCDRRSRQSREHVRFAEAVRNIALFCDGVVVPGALVLLLVAAHRSPRRSASVRRAWRETLS